jgi:hypothetical protein
MTIKLLIMLGEVNDVAIPAERLGSNATKHLKRLTAPKRNCVAKGPLSGVTNARSCEVIQRDDGLFEIGLSDPSGPFESRRFAESVAAREVRHARTT